MKNGRGEKREANVSVARTRAKVRAPLQFRVNECWRAPRHRRRAGEHARVRPGQKGETKTEIDREKGTEREREGEKENANIGPRARTCGRRKRQLQLGAATRPPPSPRFSSYTILQVRFHGARSCSLVLSPPLPSCTLFLSLSLCRAGPNITVLFRLLSILFSFFIAPTSRASCRYPSSCTVTCTRMYARTPKRGRAPKRTTGLVTCSLADSQRSYGHRRHLA